MLYVSPVIYNVKHICLTYLKCYSIKWTLKYTGFLKHWFASVTHHGNNKQSWFFGPNFRKKCIFGSKHLQWQLLYLKSELKIVFSNILPQTGNFWSIVYHLFHEQIQCWFSLQFIRETFIYETVFTENWQRLCDGRGT